MKDVEVAANTLNQVTSQRQSFIAQANPQTAQRIAEIYRQYPMLSAGVVLSAAKSGMTDDVLKKVAERAYKVAETDPESLNPASTKQKSWFERNVKDKLKTGSRWTTAALNFPTEFVQGGIAQIFDSGDDGSVKGWFASTELGTMVMEDEKSGSGFFVGGDAKKNQGRRAREYRGTIDGHAWTVGRGAASVFLPEKSTAFNLMSGLIDAGVTLSIPAVPGAGEVADLARGLQTAGKAGVIADTIANVSNALGKTGSVINGAKAQEFIQSGRGQRLVRNLMDANTLDDVYKATNDGLFLDTALKLRDAKTEAEIVSVLNETLGTQKALSTTLIPGAGRTYQSRKAITDTIEKFPGLNRQLSTMPDFNFKEGHVSVNLSATAPQDKVHTMRQVDRWLTQFKAPDDVRRSVIDELGDALSETAGSRVAQKNVGEKLEGIFKQSLIDEGVDEDIAGAILARQRDITAKARRYHVDDAGNPTDAGFNMALVGQDPSIQEGVLAGPHLASELADTFLDLPDPRVIRRLTGNMGWISGKTQAGALRRAGRVAQEAPLESDANLDALRRAGELRMPFAMIDWVQDKWRTTTLMTVAYSMRNLLEGQARLALNPYGDNTSAFKHPLMHIMWSTRAKGSGDVTGNLWNGIPIGEAAQETQREFSRAVGSAVSSYYNDPVPVFAAAKRTGSWDFATKGAQDKELVVLGHGDQLGKLNADFGARAVAAGLDNSEILRAVGYGGQAPDLALLQRVGASPEDAQRWWRDVRDLHNEGRPQFQVTATGTPKYLDETVQIDLNVPHNMNLYLNETRERVQAMTGNHRELLDVVHLGLLPSETVAKTGLSRADVGQVRELPVLDAKGKQVGVRTVRVQDIDDVSGDVIVRAFPFRNNENTTGLKNLLGEGRIYDDVNMPRGFAHEGRVPEYAKKGSKLSERFDEGVNRWFSNVYGKPSAYLERSPAFRQQYYQWIDQLLPSMRQDALQQMVDNVRTAATNIGASPEDYLGRKGLWDKMQEYASGQRKTYNTLDIDQVDTYAKGNALDDLKEMLYDASERNNLTDIAKVVMPFVQAQLDFFKAMARAAGIKTADGLIVPNMTNIRRGQLIVDNGMEADPTNTGHGFFYKDPQTGEFSFSYPVYGPLASMLTGMGVQQIAPLKGLLLGFDFRPGLGPVGQFAASRILPDSPQFDSVRNFFLPYGETAFKGESVGPQVYKSFVPSWFQKVVSGLTDSPEGSSVYANTFMETMQALAASGDYDLTSVEGQEKLQNDAKGKARILTVMRGFIQFAGPARATPDFEVMTEKGDVLASELTKAFYEMQNDQEAGGYQTAVQRFLDTFGEDVFIYLGRKTRSTAGGLEASTAFGKFERENDQFFQSHKTVAGYFAPGGPNFDFQVYARQLQTGRRERLTPQELLDEAQRTVGFSFYKRLRDQAGPYPNQAQRDYLSEYRQFLIKKYPGFGKGTIKTSSERENLIRELRTAAEDPRMATNKSAEGIKMYLAKRDEALASASTAGLKTLSGKAAAPIRDYLRHYGEIIARNNNDFGKVWERLLSYEVDLDS